MSTTRDEVQMATTLDDVVGALTSSQQALLHKIDALAGDFEHVASPSSTRQNLGLYAAKLQRARERVVQASSTLKALEVRIEKVEERVASA